MKFLTRSLGDTFDVPASILRFRCQRLELLEYSQVEARILLPASLLVLRMIFVVNGSLESRCSETITH